MIIETERLLLHPFVESDAADGRCLVYSESGEPLALCEAKGGTLRTIKSFFEV